MKFIRVIASAIGIGSRAFVALIGVAGITAAVANYAMTQGSGTTFGSIVVSTVHYAQQLLCDPTTPANCATVKAGNTAVVADVAQVVSDPNVVAAVNQPIPPQSPAVPIGGTGICDGANGTTNPCTNAATVKAASTPAAASDKALVVDQRPGTTILAGADPSSGKATPTMAFLAFPATTTTQIIALSGTKVTYVTMAKVFAGGTVNLTFKYGTGSNCGTGTTTLEGPYALTAQSGWVEGDGWGPVMIVPAGQALCVTTDATVTNSGVKLVYQQF